MPCGPPRRTGFLPRSGKFKGSLYESRCFLTPGAGHVLLLWLLIRLFFHAGKSALHWAAAVNNVEATLLLLKNGANRDMQDNKVRSGLRAGGREAAPREAGPSLSSHRPLVRSQDTGEREGQELGPQSRSKGIGLSREGPGSSPPPARPPLCTGPSCEELRCHLLGLCPLCVPRPAVPRCVRGHVLLSGWFSYHSFSLLLVTGPSPVCFSSSEL